MPPFFTGCPTCHPEGRFPRPLKRGVSVTRDAGLCLQVAGSGLCLWLYWDSQAMPLLPKSVVLHLDCTCSLLPCDEGTGTSNNSAGMLRVGIPFGKPRARNTYTAPQTFQMLSLELRLPQGSVKLQSLPSLQTMMGSHEKNVLISWLVHDISTGIQDELLTKGPSHKGTRESLRPRISAGLLE